MELTKEKYSQAETEIKILVVDDRQDNLFSIETILEKDNYTIITANSGRAALKILLQQHDFSLILMDVQMPDMNGFETANIIYQRDKLKNIPIIFITAHNYDEEYVFKGYKMGGVEYIYKPINPELLRIKVGVFVELYRKNHQLRLNEEKLIAANESLKKEIAERKASELQVRLLNKQLLENNNQLKIINEELDRFAFVASHDLQEPLRKIILFSDVILKKDNLPGEINNYLEKIVSSSQRMQALITDLLHYSSHDIHVSDFIETDLNQVVNETLLELEVEIEKSEAVVNVQPLPSICVIPVLMQQLFYNLIGNALKFRKNDRTPVINIFSEKINSGEMLKRLSLNGNTNYHKITISDNGIGFDQKYGTIFLLCLKDCTVIMNIKAPVSVYLSAKK